MVVHPVFRMNKNLVIMNHGNGSKRALVNGLSPMPGSRREAIQS